MEDEFGRQFTQRLSAHERNRLTQILFERRRSASDCLDAYAERLASGTLTDAESGEMHRAEREFNATTVEVFTLNIGLVHSYACRFTGKSAGIAEDIESAGRVGLMMAIDSYRPGKGSTFGSWAFKPIRREILQAVRQLDHQHLNASDFDKRPAVLKAAEDFAAAHPAGTPRDIAQIAKNAKATVNQTLRILNATRVESLHSLVRGSDRGLLADRLGDHGPTVEDQVLLNLDVELLWQSIDLLDTRELFVLTHRFGLDGGTEQTLESIGRSLGLSREAVRQIQVKALTKLTCAVAQRPLDIDDDDETDWELDRDLDGDQAVDQRAEQAAAQDPSPAPLEADTDDHPSRRPEAPDERQDAETDPDADAEPDPRPDQIDQPEAPQAPAEAEGDDPVPPEPEHAPDEAADTPLAGPTGQESLAPQLDHPAGPLPEAPRLIEPVGSAAPSAPHRPHDVPEPPPRQGNAVGFPRAHGARDDPTRQPRPPPAEPAVASALHRPGPPPSRRR